MFSHLEVPYTIMGRLLMPMVLLDPPFVAIALFLLTAPNQEASVNRHLTLETFHLMRYPGYRPSFERDVRAMLDLLIPPRKGGLPSCTMSVLVWVRLFQKVTKN